MNNSVAARAGGYITDIPYVVRYHRGLNPSLLRLAVAMQGIVWERDQTCDYIELGCGFGLTALFNAAGHPDARFTAIDINPEHIDTARGIASSARLGNIDFIEGAFADLDSGALQARMAPAFDVIVMHGIWSWISAENRAHIMRFIDRCLKPGGLLYLSYNTLPGLASALPLRQLMRMGFDTAEGATEIRVDAGVKFADKIRDAGSAYFVAQPRAALALDEIKPKSRNALAHEYFNADWTAFYHADVAASLAPLGLSYAGSAHLLDNIDHLNYSAAGRELLAGQPSPRREMLKDFLANREFRRDIYIRGEPEKRDARGLLGSLPFVTAGKPGGESVLSAVTALGKVTLKPAQSLPVLTAMQDGPATPLELLNHPACQGLKGGDLLDTILVLTALSGADLALPPDHYDARKAACARLNAVLWEAAQTVDVISASVSPLTGGGVGLDRIEQLFLLARHRDEEPEPFLRRLFGANVSGDVAGGYAQFVEKRLPILRKLGIV